MKFSYNWIRELVENLDQPPGPLERLITMKTAECEGIELAGELLERACAARVESVEPIANTHNVKAVVDAGRYGRKTVVCGAPNCRAGLITAYAPVGTKIISGVESDGMLASGAELGINHDHAGVIELDCQVGAPLPGCVADRVIEIDNKSITHRPDLWGHLGMAREVAAILGHKLKDPVNSELLPGGEPAIPIHIQDFNLCPRYSALVFENVTVKPSPYWLQCRLTAIGLNPINNIVDMTNYVMAELAQPMHAFDKDLLKGEAIFIRPAHPGEQFRALNEEEYTLDASNLVIADTAGAIALGGVIGGLDSAISEKTTRVVLESANFNASSIRKTSVGIKLRTDASMRFEKAQDPANTVRGLACAIELLEEISPGIRLVGGVADAKRLPPPPPPIEFPLEWAARKLGRKLDTGEARTILERLEFGVAEPRPRVFSVTVPSWRATKDISIKDDLVEEIGRMVGYDSIPLQPPMVPTTVPPGNPARKFQHEARDIFADEGFTEVYNYSFLSEDAARAFGFAIDAHVRVANPIASDQALMRTSLLPGIWKNILENAKHKESFRLFEIGREIHKRYEGLPEEVPHLAAAIYDRHGDGAAGLFELKRAAECLMPGAQACPPIDTAAYEHPARTADISWRGERVGRLFELHPSMVETGRAAVLDLDLAKVRALSAEERKYTPVRRFPSSAFDLSVVAGLREPAARLGDAIRSMAGPLVETVEFVRQYSGPPLPEGRKSVSFRVTAGSGERTLSSDEVSAIRERIIQGMRARGYDLRV
ncbi:MAG TPA: phenylalanine--tRNA ligase subunit beta [Bryobacteraceae bacterium]